MFGTRTVRWIVCGAMTLAGLVLAHDLAFFARYGSQYGEALAHAGHGQAWSLAVASALVLGSGLLIGGLIQLRRLAAVGRTAQPVPRTRGMGLATLVGPWARLAVPMAGVIALLLTVQENVERAAAGIWPPNPGLLLSTQYPDAIAIVAAVAAAVSLVATLFRWRRDVLLARIAQARPARPHPTAQPRPIERLAGRPRSALGRRLGLRAPPQRTPLAA